jgi:hypothetical protein
VSEPKNGAVQQLNSMNAAVQPNQTPQLTTESSIEGEIL